MLCDGDIAHYGAAGSAQRWAFQKMMDVHMRKSATAYMALLRRRSITPCGNTREDARQEGLQVDGHQGADGTGAGGSDGGGGGAAGGGGASGGGGDELEEEEYEFQEDNEESALEPEPDPTNSASHQVLLGDVLHGALARMNIGGSKDQHHCQRLTPTSWSQ